MIALVHRTYEDGRLVVEHRFYGDTPAHAQAVYQAHRKTDWFIQACDDQGEFDTIKCRTTLHFEITR